MSPFWIDFRLSLSAEGLVFVAVQGRFGMRKTLHEETRPLGSLDTLAQTITDVLGQCSLPTGARARVKVVVGEPYARYMALPWQDGLYSPQDWQAYAQHMMATHFCEEAPDWKVGTTVQGYGHKAFASAIDNRLFDAIRAGVAEVPRANLYSVRPLLAHAMHRRQFSLLRASYGLVVVSLGSASCVFVDGGQCEGVVSLPFDANTPLAAMLTDATLLCGVQQPSYLYVLATGSASLSKEHLSPLGKHAKWLGSADPVLWGRKLTQTQFAELTGHGEF